MLASQASGTIIADTARPGAQAFLASKLRFIKASKPAFTRIITVHTASAYKQGMTDTNHTNHIEPHLTLVPRRFTKVVHFIRHGEGFHNIGYEDNLDAHLTPFGWHQAETLGEHIRNQQPPLDIQLVVVSPLMRTLETVTGVFGGGPVSSDSSDVLMLGKDEEPRVRSAHAAVAKPGSPPFVANELCRERMGPNMCDARRPLRETRAAFPGVDFSGVATDDDVLWRELHATRNASGEYDEGESEDATTLRGIQLLKWLMDRPESMIAVVSHAGLIRHTLSAFAAGLPEEARKDLTREFANCEMRSVVIGDVTARAQPDLLHFPGGRMHGWREAAAK